MPLALQIPTTKAWNKTSITLGGVDYEFTLRFNGRDSRWRMDIEKDGLMLVAGLKLVENNFLLTPYRLDEFNHGDIICARLKKDLTPVGRNNLGPNKSYQLIYYTYNELEALS